MSKHESTEAVLKRLIENPFVPNDLKDLYRERLKELQEKGTENEQRRNEVN